MTHRSDDQSFEDTFDNAVRELHQQTPRGNRPSSRAWKLVAEQAGLDESKNESLRSDRITPHAYLSAESRPGFSPQPKNHLGWSTWLAAALVVILIGASVNFLMPEGDGGRGVSDQSIALAPGTPDVSTLEPASIASPAASPDLYTPVHGPEFVCDVEPMTEEEVYQIILNPGNGYFPESSGLWESPNHWMSKERERQAAESYAATDDPELTEPITETANTFWNCLMNGSAYQVWAMMEPSAVQHEILIHYPVLRDEKTLRRHISVWGPRRYSASIYHVFPDLGNVDSYQASMRVMDRYGAIRIGYSGDDPWKALVLMQSHPEAPGYKEHYLLLQRAPDGTWWASMIFYE